MLTDFNSDKGKTTTANQSPTEQKRTESRDDEQQQKKQYQKMPYSKRVKGTFMQILS